MCGRCGAACLSEVDRGQWPLDRAAKGSDEERAAKIVEELGLDQIGFFRVMLKVETFLKDRSVNRAVAAVGSALLARGALSGAEVHRIIEDDGGEPMTDAVQKSRLFTQGEF